MKKLFALLLAVEILTLALVGCADEPSPSLIYIVDGEVFCEDVLKTETERFDALAEIPKKDGYLFGGWFYDEGTYSRELDLTVLNAERENKEYRVFAKWEVVSLSFDKETLSYTVTGLLGGATDRVSIPEKIDGYPVVAIAPKAFKGNTTLSSITLPSSLKTIGDRAFEGCTALKNISVPHGVTSLGRYTFSGCTALESVSLSASLTAVEAYTFSGCTALLEVTVHSGVTTIGHAAFANCTSLSSLTLPKSVKTLGTEILSGSTALTTISFSGSKSVWEKISKTDYALSSALTAIRCTDGQVAP